MEIGTVTQQAQDNQQQAGNDPNGNDPKGSVVSRVANYTPEAKKEAQSDDIQFNPQDFDKIESVEDAKKYAETAYKSFEKGFQKKFQDLAELKKTLENQVTNSSSWTTEKIQSLLQDPSFVSAAQGVLGQSNQSPQGDDDGYSALSDTEKRKIQAIEDQNRMLLQQQNNFLMKQQDEMLKSKFPNYKPEAVDTITADLLQGKVKNTREYIWKAYDYEEGINRAYQLGMQDARKNLNENIQGASFDSGVSTTPSTPIVKEKGESNENLLKRLYTNALRNRRTP
jgi:hypothetical protein